MGLVLRAWQQMDFHAPYPLAQLEANPARALCASLLARGVAWDEAEFWLDELRADGDETIDRVLRAELQLFHGIDVPGAELALESLAQGEDAVAARAGEILAWPLWQRGELERAGRLIRRLERLAPEVVGVQLLLGALLEYEGDQENALGCFRRAHEARPQSAETLSALANALLLRGQLREGFWRWAEKDRVLGIFTGTDTCPIWQGEPLGRKRILLNLSHGFGDRIQLMRFAAQLRAREPEAFIGATISAPLLRLTEASGLFDAVHVDRADYTQYDCQTISFELPSLLGVESPDNVWTGPYLRIAGADVAQAAAWLGERKPGIKRVGLCWRGSVSMLDRKRSVPAAALAPLFKVPGIEWFALIDDAQKLPEAAAYPLRDLSSQLTDFYATGALISNLDLVISVDTSVAHLTGALGVPGWVLTRPDPEWRWSYGGNSTPWYGSLRVFRHPPRQFDWAPVLAAATAALAAWAAGDGNTSQ